MCFYPFVRAMEEAVELVAQDKAPKIVQPAEGATYDAFLNKVIYFLTRTINFPWKMEKKITIFFLGRPVPGEPVPAWQEGARLHPRTWQQPGGVDKPGRGGTVGRRIPASLKNANIF